MVRAVILPPLAAIPKGDDHSRITDNAVPAPELERDLVPVPSAASKVLIDLPLAPTLELAEVSSASEQQPPPLPLDTDEPSGAESEEPDVPELAVDEDSAQPFESPVQPDVKPETLAMSAVAPVISAEAALIGSTAQPVEASELEPSLSSASATPNRKASKIWLLAALWVVSAAVPALVVWQTMRAQANARCVAANLTSNQYQARAAVNVSPPLHPESLNPASAVPSASSHEAAVSPVATASSAEPTSSSSSPAVSTEVPAGPVNAPSVAAESPSVDPAASATIPTTAVVVETDSTDRVSVLLQSKPNNAKVLRRGKEIGRTPLTIQIGRGEHRVFEVAAYGFGAKRVTIDGEKPEVLVNMLPEKAPPTKFVPATLPERKYERLQ